MSKHTKIRHIIHYVKPTAQLLFKIRFPKGGPTCRRQVVNPRHQTPQGFNHVVLSIALGITQSLLSVPNNATIFFDETFDRPREIHSLWHLKYTYSLGISIHPMTCYAHKNFKKKYKRLSAHTICMWPTMISTFRNVYLVTLKSLEHHGVSYDH